MIERRFSVFGRDDQPARRVSRIIEIALSVFFLMVSAIVYLLGPRLVQGWVFTVPGTTDAALTPAFFPRLSTILIALAASSILVTLPLRRNALPFIVTEPGGYRNVFVGLIGVLCYIAIVYFLGFVVASTLFITIATMVGGYRRWTVVVPSAIFVSVCLRLIFRYGLHVQLPEGLLM